MKFLIFDHFFQQDIEALRVVATGHQLRVFQASVLSDIARKYLPAWAFGSFDPQGFARTDYVKAYQHYEEKSREVLHDLYLTFPFDAVIAPSDVFPYIRPWVTQTHELGLPFIVLQKETTVMPLFMIENARAIGQVFPFIGDLMLVCSERLKQFWLNTGAVADKIVVTGQPRFDFYRCPERWQTWAELGLQIPVERPTILFLSYDVGITYAIGSDSAPTWMQLRTETEMTLIDMARQSRFNVLIKPHPQQQGFHDYQEKLRKMAGPLWGKTVQFISGLSDARQLITNADVIVGFQTTGLIEAMAAGKKPVYTFWTEPAMRVADDLIPFHQMEDVLSIAHSPQELESLLLSERENVFTEEQTRRRLHLVEEHLGPLDGHASERCLKLIEDYVADYADHAETAVLAFRRDLDMWSPAYCRRQLPLARLASAFWGLVEWLLPVVYPIWLVVRWLQGKRGPASTRRRIVERRLAAEEKAAYCRNALNEILGVSRQGG